MGELDVLYEKIAALVREEAEATRVALEGKLSRMEEQLCSRGPGSISLPTAAQLGPARSSDQVPVQLPNADTESSSGSDLSVREAQKETLGKGVSFVQEPETKELQVSKSSKHMMDYYMQMEYSVAKQIFHKYFGFVIDWWLSLKEPERTGRIADFVLGGRFESLCIVAIISNAVLMLLASNYEAKHINSDEDPPKIFEIWDMALLIFYTVELCIKLGFHRFYFFCNDDMGWNLFDLVLVAISLLDFVASILFNVTILRSVRLLKVAKVLRVFRLMRFLHELRLILKCIIGSIASLTWSIVMMVLIFFMFGTCFVQGCTNYLTEESIKPEGKTFKDMQKYFGSVEGSILSLFSVATGGGDWTLMYTTLGPAGKVYQALFLFFIAYTYIAFLNILTAIFVESAMKNAQPDNDLLAFEFRKEKIQLAENFHELCMKFAQDSDGNISRDAFFELIDDEAVRAHLEVLGIDVGHAFLFFKMLEQAHHDHHVSLEDLVQGCMKMRGIASSLDMQRVLYEGKMWHRHQRREIHDLKAKVNKICSCLEAITKAANQTAPTDIVMFSV